MKFERKSGRMRRVARHVMQSVANTMGVELRRFPEHRQEFRLAQVARRLDIDLAIDVGANTGQWSREMRRYGYRGALLSFEPLSEPFNQLAILAAGDRDWLVSQTALGPDRGSAQMGVSGNGGASSSILPILERATSVEPSATYVGTESVQVSTLDVEVARYAGSSRRWLLKLDVQGYEGRVLDGGGDTLRDPRLRLIQVEISLTRLYAGAASWIEILDRMDKLGFWPIRFDGVFEDPETREVLQVDVLVARKD